MSRKLVGFVVLAVLMAAVGLAHAMTLLAGEANVVELLEQSNDIVVGRVGSVTDGIDDRGIPYTEVTLEVSETIRGYLSGQYKFRQFGLLAPRLSADDTRKMMPAPPGFPKYSQGEEVVLFLRPAAARTGFRMPAGVTQGKFTLGPGRVANENGNAGLFLDVRLEEGLATDNDKRMMAVGGAANPDTFLSFVRRAVEERWIETGRITRAARPSDPVNPPPSEPGDEHATPPATAEPQTGPLDPNTNIALPRSGR